MRVLTTIAAAALALSPAGAFAQAGAAAPADTTTTITDGSVDTTAAPAIPADNDDDFPWGLLGLLGLAGLAGLKRRDDHRVDARRTA